VRLSPRHECSLAPGADGSAPGARTEGAVAREPILGQRRITVLVLAVALGSAGCGEPPPPVVPSDAGARDASRMDAARDDAGETETDGAIEGDAAALDAALTDGDVPDAPIGIDAPTGEDAGPPEDGGPLLSDDAGPCFLDGGAFDHCSCDPPVGDDCSASACTGGETCVPDGCGAHCVPPGRACGTAADCPAGSTCTAFGSSSFCVRPAGCADSRDCPAGHACEAGACRDRRIRCSYDVPCPFGFVCLEGGVGIPYCVRANTRCDTDAACPLSLTCNDVDGDGSRDCNGTSSSCTVNADCPARMTCETRPTELSGICGGHGPCRNAADCPVGSACVDLWGDGISECVATGGSCTATADCPGTAVCASPAEGGAPRCIDRPL
jgi:hypothetical protein